MKTLPNKIKVRITEKDRQNASHFQNTHGCIIHTALQRMGYNHDTPLRVGLDEVEIGEAVYLPNKGIHGRALGAKRPRTGVWDSAVEPPYYRKSIVGKTITLTKQHESIN